MRHFSRSIFRILSCSLLLFASCESRVNASVLEEKTWKVGAYTVAKKRFNWKGEDSGAIEVSLHGKQLLRRQAHDVWVWTKGENGEFVEAENQNKLSLSDLNGDGVPDFVVRQWSGGAYCCYTYEIFSMSPDCKRLWHNEAGCAHLKIIEPRSTAPKANAGTSEGKCLKPRRSPATLAMEDGSFLYWRTHTLQGPRPIVYFTGGKNGFTFNRFKTLKPTNQARLAKLMNQSWSEESEAFFIQLVYTGNVQDALTMLNKLEPSERTEFARSFMDVFRKSPFYYRIVELNSKSAIAKLQRLSTKPT